MSVISNNQLAGASGQGGTGQGGAYEIERSLRFNSSDSAYLSRTPASASNQKTYTCSVWLKRSDDTTGRQIWFAAIPTSTNYTQFCFENNKLTLYFRYNSGTAYTYTTDALFRDPSAWYHVVIAVDSTQATASDRLKIYVNGVSFSYSGTLFPQNTDTTLNSAVQHAVSSYQPYASGAYFNGYMADMYFIDGSALGSTSFGAFDTNGVWQPKAYTGTYGTNGFHLPFSDNSTAAALGTDTSGNSNTWTVNNISVAAGSGNDSFVDTPTNYGTDTGAGGEVRGNYCTWNPLAVPGTQVLSNGNLDVSTSSVGNIIGTIFLTSGKWYWEVNAGGYVAICGRNGVGFTGSVSASGSDAYGYWNNGSLYSGVGGFITGGATFTSSDTIGVALDMDGGTVKWYKNNVLQHDVTLNEPGWEDLRGGVFPCINGGTTTAYTFTANFGQRPFAYTAPSGYKALCTQNLPTPTIADGSTVMDVALYTGNGSTQTISGLGFSPDLVWNKARSHGYGHTLFDSVRGAGEYLAAETTAAESDLSPNGLTSFNSDGWTESAVGGYNANGTTYVAWTWDAGSSTVSNTDGSITSQVRANASAGFSIVTWTGTANATVGHGLNAAPQLVITKSRNNNVPWRIWSAEFSNAAADYMGFDTSGAATFPGTYWGSMTSTTIGMSSTYHNNMGDMVAYCFAPVDGYSSFGSYTGNGSTDGPFVYTGFRPRWVMVKSTSITGWAILDAARNTYNLANSQLFPHASDAELTSPDYFTADFLSNGFKLRTTNSPSNTNTQTYIYAAFAEHPFAHARAR